jgi:hypothetical protein
MLAGVKDACFCWFDKGSRFSDEFTGRKIIEGAVEVHLSMGLLALDIQVDELQIPELCKLTTNEPQNKG